MSLVDLGSYGTWNTTERKGENQKRFRKGNSCQKLTKWPEEFKTIETFSVFMSKIRS